MASTLFINALSPRLRTRWGILNQSGGAQFGGTLTSDGSQASSVTYDFYADIGTYSIDIFHLGGTNRPIYAVSVDGQSVGTADGYNATSVSKYTTVTGVTIGSSGRHSLTLLCSTKNASSTAFVGAINGITLRKA